MLPTLSFDPPHGLPINELDISMWQISLYLENELKILIIVYHHPVRLFSSTNSMVHIFDLVWEKYIEQ